MNIMLDLETMGTGPDAAIAAIGAVVFSADGLGDTFYAVPELASSVALGGQIDPDTVLWWLKQPDPARQALLTPTSSLLDALCRFAIWIDPVGARDAIVWGNGADFDNVILASAYRNAHLPIPWRSYNNRCYRTLRAAFPDIPRRKRTGTAHHALDDARTQALHAVEILRAATGLPQQAA